MYLMCRFAPPVWTLVSPLRIDTVTGAWGWGRGGGRPPPADLAARLPAPNRHRDRVMGLGQRRVPAHLDVLLETRVPPPERGRSLDAVRVRAARHDVGVKVPCDEVEAHGRPVRVRPHAERR